MNTYMHSRERSARTRFQPGELPSLPTSPRQEEAFQHFWSARTTSKAFCNNFYRAFASVVYFSTHCAPVETFVRGVTTASAFLSSQSFLASTIIMSFRPTMSARLVSSCTILITLPVTQSWLGRMFIFLIHRLVGLRGAVKTSLFFI